MKVGYIRVSTKEQNTARQEIIMSDELGVEKVYIEYASGKDCKRTQLNEMMNFVRDGDCVIVESISRFARNTADLLNLIAQLTEKNVMFISKKEAIDTTTPTGQFMLTVFAAVAQLERDYMLQRQREGIDAAQSAGVKFGRKRKVDLKKFEKEYQSVIEGKRTKAQLARDLKISDSSFRNYEAELMQKNAKTKEVSHNE